MNSPSPGHQKERAIQRPGVRGIAFDLDDTLFSRRLAIGSLFNSWGGSGLGSAGLDEIIARDACGYHDRDAFFGWLAGHLGSGFSGAELHRRFIAELPGHIPLQHRTISLLDALKAEGYRLAILTNGGSQLQRAKLQATGIPGCLNGAPVIISGDTPYEKPDREIFQLLAQAMGLPAGEILFVGDHLTNDVGGALAAGFQAAWLRPAHTTSGKPPDGAFVIDELEDLIKHLAGNGHN